RERRRERHVADRRVERVPRGEENEQQKDQIHVSSGRPGTRAPDRCPGQAPGPMNTVRACVRRPVFMGSGFAASRRPGIAAVMCGAAHARLLRASSRCSQTWSAEFSATASTTTNSISAYMVWLSKLSYA